MHRYDYDLIYYYNKKEKLITHMYLNDWDWDRCELWVLNEFIELIFSLCSTCICSKESTPSLFSNSIIRHFFMNNLFE